jgi:hypothetical protein
MPEREFRLMPSEGASLRERLRSCALPVEGRAQLDPVVGAGAIVLDDSRGAGVQPPNYISRWKRPFEAERLTGLYSRHPGRAVEKRILALEARILERTRSRI